MTDELNSSLITSVLDKCESNHYYAKIKKLEDGNFIEQGCPFCLKIGQHSLREDIKTLRTQNAELVKALNKINNLSDFAIQSGVSDDVRRHHLIMIDDISNKAIAKAKDE